MKLERILERLNSLEKGQFLKIINNLSAEERNNPKLESILSRADSNLKNADAIQVTQAFEALSDRYVSYVMEDYSKVSSQLDILLNIITRDGNCIMRLDWFAKLYEEEIKKQKKRKLQRQLRKPRNLLQQRRLQSRYYPRLKNSAPASEAGLTSSELPPRTPTPLRRREMPFLSAAPWKRRWKTRRMTSTTAFSFRN